MKLARLAIDDYDGPSAEHYFLVPDEMSEDQWNEEVNEAVAEVDAEKVLTFGWGEAPPSHDTDLVGLVGEVLVKKYVIPDILDGEFNFDEWWHRLPKRLLERIVEHWKWVDETSDYRPFYTERIKMLEEIINEA